MKPINITRGPETFQLLESLGRPAIGFFIKDVCVVGASIDDATLEKLVWFFSQHEKDERPYVEFLDQYGHLVRISKGGSMWKETDTPVCILLEVVSVYGNVLANEWRAIHPFPRIKWEMEFRLQEWDNILSFLKIYQR